MTGPAGGPDLERIARDYAAARAAVAERVVICAGTGCLANGAARVRGALLQTLAGEGLAVTVSLEKALSAKSPDDPAGTTYVSISGCQGFCQMGPLVRIEGMDLLYVKVKVEDVPEIVERTLKQRTVIERLLYTHPTTGARHTGDDEIPFYARQKRIVMRNATIDPESISEYIARGGYAAARRAVTEMTSEAICQMVLDSGLRGRGGGGFPTGRKWKFALEPESKTKYVICNGDEGDPGAFMDRSVMEGNPHSVLEGLVIASQAIGAKVAFVYVRAEYPLAVKRIRRAVDDATAMGIVGQNIFGTDKRLRVIIMEGAGAFVCGEETALIASIEGRRGMPVYRPPYPARQGLWGRPTVINNVETLSAVPYILEVGPAAYRAVGTESSPGTKTFALTGHVANTGLIEVPFGTTLREIVYNIGGGVVNGKGEATDEPFKAVQIGGPSGGCLTPKELDMPLDFDTLKAFGAMVGSGGLVVINRESCMVNIAQYFLNFTKEESCGKCTPCRIGGTQMYNILQRIISGNGRDEDIAVLRRLAKTLQMSSLCGLGISCPNPVLATLEHFEEEYLEHIRDKKCAAGVCTDLVTYTVDAAACVGCRACAKRCPVDCIEGRTKQAHSIRQQDCIHCGTCFDVCRFDAIRKS